MKKGHGRYSGKSVSILGMCLDGRSFREGTVRKKNSVLCGLKEAMSLESRVHVRGGFISPFMTFHFLPSLFDLIPPQIYHSNYILPSNTV